MRKLLLSAVLCAAGISTVTAQTDSLLRELNKHPLGDSVRFSLLKKLSSQYLNSDPQKGVEAADSAIELAKKLNSNLKVASAYISKANNLHKLGRDSESLALFSIAANMNLNLDNKRSAANAYYNTAYVYYDLGNFSMAISYLLKANEIYKILELNGDEADVYNSIANNYMRLDNYSSALKYHLQALTIYQKLKNTVNEAIVLGNIGMTYHKLSDDSTALVYYKKALLIDQQTGNKENLAHDFVHIGVLHDDEGKFDAALLYYTEALKLNREINNNREIAASLGNIASINSKKGDYTSAYKNISDALKIYEVFSDKYNIAVLSNQMGKLLADAPPKFFREQNLQAGNNLLLALQWQDKALKLAREAGSNSLAAGILEDISRTYEKNKDFYKAMIYYKQAVNLKDSTLNDGQKKQITELEMQYQFDKKEEATKALNDKKEALATQEISKQKLQKNAIIISGIILLFATAISFLFYKNRKEAIEAKKEADLKTQVTETEMKALRAQMNPHFIFNSLNSIADFIDKNQTQTASGFTIKFAKLMRMVLENSEYRQIALAADLEALELYMQLEQARLKNKFDYEILVDKNLDTENILVPPLLLQPFVENSIWHGMAKKEGHGNIFIRIQQKNEMIQYVVEDDGAGFSKASGNTEGKKSSLGMRITKERIDVMNKLKNTNATVNISTLDAGVKAEVILPLEMNF